MTPFEKGFIKQANSQGISEVEAARLLKEAALLGDNWLGHGLSAIGGKISDVWNGVTRPGQTFSQHYNNSVDQSAGSKADKLFGQYQNYSNPESFSGWQKLRSWMGHDYSHDAELTKQKMMEQAQRLHNPMAIDGYNQKVTQFDSGMQTRLDGISRMRDMHEKARNRAAQIGNKPVPSMKPAPPSSYPMLTPVSAPAPSATLNGGRNPYKLTQF